MFVGTTPEKMFLASFSPGVLLGSSVAPPLPPPLVGVRARDGPWSAILRRAGRDAITCALAASLATGGLRAVHADVGVLSEQGVGVAAARAVSGSPVAEEVWALLDKYFLDRTFNGVDLAAERLRLQQMAPLSETAALDESEALVRRLGDRFSRVLKPAQTAKLGKYDVTGVGINLAREPSPLCFTRTWTPLGLHATEGDALPNR